jgi:outer membrane lipoprotein-sorting protein
MRRRSLLATIALAPLAACQSLPTQGTSGSTAEINRVQAYLNGIKTLQARFVQVGPDGTRSEGTLWMDRPGRLRLQYAPPTPLTLVAAHGTVLIYNASNQGTTTMPLAHTPLSILLQPTITLSGSVTVTQVQSAPSSLAITTVRTSAPRQGALTLLFSRPPRTLRSIRVVDAEGHVTELTLLALRPNVPVNPAVFQL